ARPDNGNFQVSCMAHHSLRGSHFNCSANCPLKPDIYWSLCSFPVRELSRRRERRHGTLGTAVFENRPMPLSAEFIAAHPARYVLLKQQAAALLAAYEGDS